MRRKKVNCSSKCGRKPWVICSRECYEEMVVVPGLQGESRWPNRVRIPAQRREEAGQVCILNRTRLGKLIKISSGPNWEEPEEAGSCGGGAAVEGHD